jgi:hypothetical protein
MSLIEGARALATNEYQIGCTVEHVFLAALPPYGYTNLDQPAKQVLNMFSGDTLEKWKLQVQAKLRSFTNPPALGQDSQDLKEALAQAQRNEAQLRRDRDDDRCLLLAVVMRSKHIQEYVEAANQGDLRRLLDRLSEGRTPGLSVPDVSGVRDAAKQKAEEEAKLARAHLADHLREFRPTDDRRYADLQGFDVSTFLDFLADAAVQAQVIVAVGRDGTLIDEIPKAMADRLARKDTFKGQQSSLAVYTGKLYVLDMRAVLSHSKQANAPKPASLFRAAHEYVLGLPERSILMLDHVEAIKSDAKEPEIEDLRTAIADPGRLLVFGIFHAPNHGDHTAEANLGREEIIKTLPMTVFNKQLTLTLLAQFYLPLWRKELPRGYEFADDAFDALIELEPGAWVHRRRTMLPGLVAEVVADAMVTAARGPDQVKATAEGALLAFAELSAQEAPSSQDRPRFEKVLKQAETDVRNLAQPPKPTSGPLNLTLFGARTQPPDPNRPIKITAAHVLAEFICHNVSEFHYPGNAPLGITPD